VDRKGENSRSPVILPSQGDRMGASWRDLGFLRYLCRRGHFIGKGKIALLINHHGTLCVIKEVHQSKHSRKGWERTYGEVGRGDRGDPDAEKHQMTKGGKEIPVARFRDANSVKGLIDMTISSHLKDGGKDIKGPDKKDFTACRISKKQKGRRSKA